MNIIKIAWKNIWYKPLAALLNVGLFALSVGMITFLINVSRQVQEQFDNNLAGVQLIIGAKGSPLQLVLCNLFHIDTPTGNISLKEAKPFLNPKHPWIQSAVPLGLGDSYKGFRIVGTTSGFQEIYNLEISEGAWWTQSMEAVIGHNIAGQLDLKIGDEIISNHGLLAEDLHSHDDKPIKIYGILNRSNTVADNLILTSMQTVWEVHEEHDHDHEGHEHAHDEHDHDHDHHDHDHGHAHNHDHEHDHHHDHDHRDDEQTTESLELATNIFGNESEFLIKEENQERDITSILVRFKGTNMQSLNMQRNINENTNLQASSPPIELNRLFSLLGIGISTLTYIAIALLIVAGLSILLSFFNVMRERKQEIVMMKIWGGGKLKIASIVILEGVIIALVGALIGLIGAHKGIYFFNLYLESDYKYSIYFDKIYTTEWLIVALSIGIGALGALLPAWVSSGKSLSENLK